MSPWSYSGLFPLPTRPPLPCCVHTFSDRQGDGGTNHGHDHDRADARLQPPGARRGGAQRARRSLRGAVPGKRRRLLFSLLSLDCWGRRFLWRSFLPCVRAFVLSCFCDEGIVSSAAAAAAVATFSTWVLNTLITVCICSTRYYRLYATGRATFVCDREQMVHLFVPNALICSGQPAIVL